MKNELSAAELKRRGMAAIEEAIQKGPVHIVKCNEPVAVVLSEAAYQRLRRANKGGTPKGMTAIRWLLAEPSAGKRSKAQIDAARKRTLDW